MPRACGRDASSRPTPCFDLQALDRSEAVERPGRQDAPDVPDLVAVLVERPTSAIALRSGHYRGS